MEPLKRYFLLERMQNKKEEYLNEHVVIKNREDMDKILGHLFFNELCGAPEVYNIMITEIF